MSYPHKPVDFELLGRVGLACIAKMNGSEGFLSGGIKGADGKAVVKKTDVPRVKREKPDSEMMRMLIRNSYNVSRKIYIKRRGAWRKFSARVTRVQWEFHDVARKKKLYVCFFSYYVF